LPIFIKYKNTVSYSHCSATWEKPLRFSRLNLCSYFWLYLCSYFFVMLIPPSGITKIIRWLQPCPLTGTLMNQYVTILFYLQYCKPGAHNEKERLTTERRLSSNTLCLTIYTPVCTTIVHTSRASLCVHAYYYLRLFRHKTDQQFRVKRNHAQDRTTQPSNADLSNKESALYQRLPSQI